MPFMQFSFVVETNSTDEQYESGNVWFWLRRVLPVSECQDYYEHVQTMPYDWFPGDPLPEVPDSNENA